MPPKKMICIDTKNNCTICVDNCFIELKEDISYLKIILKVSVRDPGGVILLYN